MTDVKTQSAIEVKEMTALEAATEIRSREMTIEQLVDMPMGSIFSCPKELQDAGFKQDKFILDKCYGSTYNNSYRVIYFTPNQFNKREHYVDKNIKVTLLNEPNRQKKWRKHQAAHIDQYSYLSCSIGTDPEIFVRHGNGEIFPAFEFLGSVDKPIYTKDYYKQKVYWDGWQAEFQTKPNTCLGYLSDSIYYGLLAVFEEARKKDSTAKLSSDTLIKLPYNELKDKPIEYVQFGCKPSLNAYGLTPGPLDGRNIPFRSTGGHLHFGFYKTKIDKIKMIKSLDAILGVCCVSMFRNFDNPIRREFYGLVGEYRDTSYGNGEEGFEYRTLSSSWLDHPAITNLVFDLGRGAAAVGYYNFADLWQVDEKEVIEIVQTCNANKAKAVVEKNHSMLVSILKAYYTEPIAEVAYQTIINGMEYIIADPTDVIKNWKLGENDWQEHCDKNEKNWSKNAKRLLKGEKA